VGQDHLDDFFLHNGGNDLYVYSTAVVAGVNVDVEDLFEQASPCPVAGSD
jgi:hypothetical protein